MIKWDPASAGFFFSGDGRFGSKADIHVEQNPA